jgi:hypothetical protein
MSQDDNKPPLFSRWRGWYVLVLSVLLLQMLFYYWLTHVFA